MPTPIAAAIYCRISDDATAQGLGVARQEADCRALAKAKGWQVAAVFTDNDLSAWSGKPRPRYAAMMAALAAGEVGAVVAYNAERLYRRLGDLAAFIEAVQNAGADVATVSGGDYDLNTADGRMTAGIHGVVAEHQSSRTAERVRSSLAAAAVAGRRHGGVRPYGWLPNRRADAYHVAGRVEIDEHEAEVIREVRDRLLAGESARGVCRVLNQRGDLSATGKPWGTTPLRRLMLSPRIIGQREHKGKVADANWPAIISPVDQSRLRIVLAGKAGASTSPRYLLSGVLTCGVCGAKLIHNPASTRNKASYICPAPPRGNWCVAVQAERAEQHLTEQALSIGDTALAPVTTPLVDTQADDARALAAFGGQWAAGRVTLADLAQGKADIEARRADAIAERTAVVVAAGRCSPDVAHPHP